MSHSSRTGAAWTAGWVLAGVAWAAGLLGVLSIGVFVLPAAALATVLLALRPAGRARWAGVLVGAGLPLAYVAYLNRSGPGTVCTRSATSQSCVDQSNPWVWLVAALLVIGAGAVLSARRRDSN